MHLAPRRGRDGARRAALAHGRGRCTPAAAAAAAAGGSSGSGQRPCSAPGLAAGPSRGDSLVGGARARARTRYGASGDARQPHRRGARRLPHPCSALGAQHCAHAHWVAPMAPSADATSTTRSSALTTSTSGGTARRPPLAALGLQGSARAVAADRRARPRHCRRSA